MDDADFNARPSVNVRYGDDEWPVDLKGMTTIKEILLSSLINHGLPVLAHEDFALYHADGAPVADPTGNAIFAGVQVGDALTLKYTPASDDGDR